MAYPDHFYRLRIEPHHIDSSGHVNNAQYLTLLEEARWDIFKTSPLSREQVHAKGIAPVLLDCRLRFRRELLEGDQIEILTRVDRFEKDMLVYLRQEIRNSQGKLSLIADLRQGVFDLKERKLIPLDSGWIEPLVYSSEIVKEEQGYALEND